MNLASPNFADRFARSRSRLIVKLLTAVALTLPFAAQAAEVSLLNVSYDPTL